MSGPLKVIRDQNGYFRHPDGHPVVVIFDSKDEKVQSPHNISWQDPVTLSGANNPKHDNVTSKSKRRAAGTQALKFVNISRPVVFDKGTKRVIRSHVSKDLRRRKRVQDDSASEPLDGEFDPPLVVSAKKPRRINAAKSCVDWRNFSPQLFGSLASFTCFPITMEPHMFNLVHRYSSLVSTHYWSSKASNRSDARTEQNLGAQGWLPLAMTDAALFHLILGGTLLFDNVHGGRLGSKEICKHMNEAVRLLSTRLQESTPIISDSTIIAVAHLADYESTMASFTNWSLHMNGLHRMVQIRGGLETFDDNVKSKLLRADVFPCISTLSAPRFTADEIRSLPITPEPPTPHLRSGLRNITAVFALDRDLAIVLGELQETALALNDTPMNLSQISEILTPIQNRLLSIKAIRQANSQVSYISEACYISARIFLKTIYDYHLSLRNFPDGVITDTAIIQKMKCCLNMPEMNMTDTRGLSLWMVFLGGMVVTGTKHRAWFAARLARTSLQWNICRWEEAKSSLVEFLWVDEIHESSCRGLWDEAQITMDVLLT